MCAHNQVGYSCREPDLDIMPHAVDELADGISTMLENKRLQVLKQSFGRIRDFGDRCIVQDTLRKIAGRSTGNTLSQINQQEGIVKSIMELTSALEPLLEGSDENSESVKIALLSTLEQGVRLQNTIGYNSLTSSIAQASQQSVDFDRGQQVDLMDQSMSSSVTNSALVSNLSLRDRWNGSTRVDGSRTGLGNRSNASLAASNKSSIMFSQAEKILREHNEKLTEQIESLDSQVAHVTAERNKLRSSTRAAQQQAAREVEAARAAAAAAQAEKDQALAAAESLRQRNSALTHELSEFETIVMRDRAKYSSILKAREDARRQTKEQSKRAETAEQEIQVLSPKKERAEAEARSAKKELAQSEQEYARLKQRLEESRRQEAAKDLGTSWTFPCVLRLCCGLFAKQYLS